MKKLILSIFIIISTLTGCESNDNHDTQLAIGYHLTESRFNDILKNDGLEWIRLFYQDDLDFTKLSKLPNLKTVIFIGEPDGGTAQILIDNGIDVSSIPKD